MARGVDIFGVDLVINLHTAFDFETHMHRVGRAGRYGGKGIAITVLGNNEEAEKLLKTTKVKALDIRVLDVCKDFPYDLIGDNDFHANSLPFVVC
jgi:superfamily II DNA/RNA helicase